MRKLLIGLVIVLVLLFGVDRGGEYVAEQTAASTIQDSQELPEEPDVEIHGFPFLTQFFARDFDRIDLTATDLPIGKVTTLAELDVELDGVTTSSDFKTIQAQSAAAEARIDYDVLGRSLGAEISYQGSGQLQATADLTSLGISVRPTVLFAPTVRGGVIDFGDPTINGVADETGQITGQVTRAVNRVFDTALSLRAIPFDVTLQQVSVEEDGLHVSLTGNDLTYESKG